MESKYVIITEWDDSSYIITECLDDKDYKKQLKLMKGIKNIKNIACYKERLYNIGYELIYKRKNGIESWYGKNE